MAVFNGTPIAQGDAAKYGVYNTTVKGTLAIPASTTLAAADILALCKIPANTYISDLLIEMPDLDTGVALVYDVQDNQSTPVVYVNDSTKGRSPAVVSFENDLNAGVLGTEYTTEQQLRIVIVTGSTTPGSIATLRYRVTFTPL